MAVFRRGNLFPLRRFREQKEEMEKMLPKREKVFLRLLFPISATKMSLYSKSVGFASLDTCSMKYTHTRRMDMGTNKHNNIDSALRKKMVFLTPEAKIIIIMSVGRSNR